MYTLFSKSIKGAKFPQNFFYTNIPNMARYRRRRYFKRRSGHWSANIQEVGNTISATPGEWSASEPIMANPNQVNTFVSQTYTIKNVEISFNIDEETTNAYNFLEGITAYIMFVPQGMTVTNDYNLQHPEYIMAYKYLGSPTMERTASTVNSGGQQYQPVKVRTRLARKLQTGDSVILFIKGVNQDNNNSYILRVSGVIRWWTKAN